MLFLLIVFKFENLGKISQFPQSHHFLPLGIDIANEEGKIQWKDNKNPFKCAS